MAFKYDWEEKARKHVAPAMGKINSEFEIVGVIVANTKHCEAALFVSKGQSFDHGVLRADIWKDAYGDVQAEYQKTIDEMFAELKKEVA